MTDLPLKGIRVLAVEHYIAAPFGTMWLADAGADVIKIEPPGTGEGGRHTAPIQTERGRTSQSILLNNRNKRSLTLDLRSEAGRDVFLRLLARSDAMVSNLAAGALDRLRLGYDDVRQVKPDLVYVTVTGFGQPDGGSPYFSYPTYDLLGQAMAGLMWRVGDPGDPPKDLPIPIIDQYTSVLGAQAVLMGLVRRSLTGEGSRVDLSMYDAAVTLNYMALTMDPIYGTPQPRGALPFAPYGAYRAGDGYFVVAALNPAQWQNFCTAIERADLLRPELAVMTNRYRTANAEIRDAIEAWAANLTVREAVVRLVAAKVPAAPVQDADAVRQCAHLIARDMLIEIEDPVIGRYQTIGNPIQLSDTPPTPRRHAPGIGEHSDEILRGLAGLSPDEVADLRARGVV